MNQFDNALYEKLAVRQLIDNWVLWRDAGFWERFRDCWWPEGKMMATWTQGTGDEFIEMNKKGWDNGVNILHFQGAHFSDISGRRAIAQTKMYISQRAPVEGVLVDVVCTGRFYDFLEKRDGRWGFCLRQPIYEKDRMDPVHAGEVPKLDRALLDSFPEGYRHLAYLQSRLGFNVKKNMPGLKGERVAQLYKSGIEWLDGKPLLWGQD